MVFIDDSVIRSLANFPTATAMIPLLQTMAATATGCSSCSGRTAKSALVTGDFWSIRRAIVNTSPENQRILLSLLKDTKGEIAYKDDSGNTKFQILPGNPS